MAEIHGISGAWDAIAAKLEANQLQAEHPAEIEPLLTSCVKELAEQISQAKYRSGSEILLQEQEISQEKEKNKAELATFSEKYALEIEQSAATLDYFKHDRSIFNFIRNYFRVRRETKRLKRLRKIVQDYQDEIERPLRSLETALEDKKRDQEKYIREQCSEINARVEFLKGLAGSQELAGAFADLEMLDYLKTLPGNVHVINNLKVRVERGIRFDGNWLINAQIDHIVVTTSGLFTIKVKNWSKQVVEKKAHSDLFQQIKNASQLCYELIKPKFPGVSVRGVLAYRGSLPDNLNVGFVKALPLQDVPGYINWFKENTLNDRQVGEMVEYIRSLSEN